MKEPAKIKKPRGRATVIPGKCVACGARCQSACPVDCVEMNEAGEPVIAAEKCIGCLKCVKACPAEALEMCFTPEELQLLAALSGEVADEADEDELERRRKIAP